MRISGSLSGRLARSLFAPEPSPPLGRSMKAFSRSIGSGKTIVEFWFTPMSISVCR